ncbi:hypothetical protein ACTSEZ_16105 [Metabacillus sp. JX24]|uniref:hypothetical protein n=1 Tax=Metabacillus sp. JX24 TaxID=3240759 RepID=UPI00350EA9DC
MDKVKVSLEELLFSFYSEGLYEQGIQLKDTFFPELGDQELQLMLEIASRSLMAKDMIREVDGRYKLTEEAAELIHILSSADYSVQFSCFSSDMEREEALSVHVKNHIGYVHELHYDQQVHTIRRLTEDETVQLISKRLSDKEMPSERAVITEMSNDDLEKILEEASQPAQLSSVISKWTSELQPEDIQAFGSFMIDLSNRQSKLNTMMLLSYDKNNNPDVADICFSIPGKQNDWIVSKNQENRFNLERTSKVFLESFIPSPIFKVSANIS